MSDDKFDAIVVGAGVAGSVAALVMARAGLDVLVIERGDSAGCKNMVCNKRSGVFSRTGR